MLWPTCWPAIRRRARRSNGIRWPVPWPTLRPGNPGAPAWTWGRAGRVRNRNGSKGGAWAGRWATEPLQGGGDAGQVRGTIQAYSQQAQGLLAPLPSRQSAQMALQRGLVDADAEPHHDAPPLPRPWAWPTRPRGPAWSWLRCGSTVRLSQPLSAGSSVDPIRTPPLVVARRASLRGGARQVLGRRAQVAALGVADADRLEG